MQIEELIKELGNGITLFYGAASSGKTCLALEISSFFIKEYGKKIIYFDPKNRARYRLSTFSNEILDKIILVKPRSLKEQRFFINKLKNLDISLAVFDDITFYYRIEKQNYLEFARQLALLKTLNKIKKVPFIIIAEVYHAMEDKLIEVVGGNLIKEISSRIVRFNKNKKHYLIFNDKKIYFTITDKGIILQNHQS